jgi:formate dehydrogenase (coenzyme F420) beta subunit
MCLLLKQMLKRQLVDAVYVPMRQDKSGVVAPALVSNADLLDRADPLAPVMLVNGARAVAGLTAGDSSVRIAAVLRPCEIRALIELVKLNQARLKSLVIIGVDCAGAFDVGDYSRLHEEGVDLAPALLVRAAEGSAWPGRGVALRPACQMCEYPSPPNLQSGNAQADAVQINVGFIGVDGVLVEMDEDMAARLGLQALPDGGGRWLDWPQLTAGDMAFRQDIVQRLVSERHTRRDALMAEVRSTITSPAALASYFATCQRCHNCMVACPICYCKECLFRTGAVDRAPAGFLRLAERKGATRLLADTVLFHLTRLNHMSTSCVGCGCCESACPSDIPLTALFRMVAAQTQGLFDYVPGRRVDEEMPLMNFREAELESLGME